MGEIQEIDVYVRPDGTVRVEVRGVKGQKCLDLTKGIEELLGAQITEREQTDEFYAQEEQAVREERTRLGR